MPFLQLTLQLGHSDPAPVEDALFAVGALSVTLEDAADNPILEPAPGMLPLWPTVNAKALFAVEMSSDAVMAGLTAQLEEVPHSHFEYIADRVWEREWLKDFHAMRFGEKLWVCPDGQRPDDANAIIIDLDPGLAFGTGTHPTTALCLQWLDQYLLRNKTVIDYGCGSGILAIAALKLGARIAHGVDIDHQALIASRSNADRNQVSAALTLQLSDEHLQSADVLLANILAGPLIELAPRLISLMAQDGYIVLSGVLQEQAESIQTCYAKWCDMDTITYLDGWARLSGRRR